MDKNVRTEDVLPGDLCQVARNVVFISKATPGDDEFVLWLAPRLEAAGYTVFADIRNLEGGTRWRNDVTSTLPTRGIKMLLCCRDSTLAKEGVQEEIGIASDLVKELKDPKFIIPLRLEPYKSYLESANFNGSISSAAGPRAWSSSWAHCCGKKCRVLLRKFRLIPAGRFIGVMRRFQSITSLSA